MSQTSEGKRKRRRRKPSPVKVFFKTVISIVLVFVLAAGAAVFAYNKIIGKPVTSKGESGNTGNGGIIDSLMGKGIELNVAVFGVDGDETRTDVIFVVHFNSKTKQIGLLSIPRDTRVTLSQEVKDILDAAGRNYNSVSKINAVHAYGGPDHNTEVAVLQLEDLLGIKIDHFAKINLEGFRQVVDAIGGVEVEVPQNMRYSDPVQDLYIDLKAGLQTLDGDKAEQLVRFRHYKLGDETRVQVQQSFLKAFAKKILNTDTLISNLPDLVSLAFKYVETDVSLGDALKYSKYVKDIRMENITMETLPGAGDGHSDFIYDEEETVVAVNRLFKGVGLAEEGTVKDKNIEISNGGITEGLAGKKRDLLVADGYNIIGVSTFVGERTDNTRIIVKEEGIGEDLKKYFTDSVIEVDESLLEADLDIKIILGLDES